MIKNYREFEKNIYELLVNYKNVELLDFLASLSKKSNKIEYLNNLNNLFNLFKYSLDNPIKEIGIYRKKYSDNIILFDLFKNKIFNENYNYLLDDILYSQIDDLNNKNTNQWENISLQDYIMSGINGLIDHYGENECLINPIILAAFLELGKVYE